MHTEIYNFLESVKETLATLFLTDSDFISLCQRKEVLQPKARWST